MRRRDSCGKELILVHCFIKYSVFVYIQIYLVLMKIFKFRLKGLGFVLRCLRKDYVFNINNLKFWFNPKCAAAYCVMPGGYWNEPETHVFLDSILAQVSTNVDVIDVGASIGEMVIPAAKHNKVRHVTAFEPQNECAKTIIKSAQLNCLTNIKVVTSAASDKDGFINFYASLQNPTAASVTTKAESAESSVVPCVQIDNIIKCRHNFNIIMVIDVEGNEPAVMRGAIKLIQSSLPLIIFEYNSTSKKHFTLDDIRRILPNSYLFYRLRPNGDGRLDYDLNNTWNCVAVAANTEFAVICKSLVVE